jgi:hypothetical protein
MAEKKQWMRRKGKPKKRFVKRWEIESETTIIIHSKNSFDLQWFYHTI